MSVISELEVLINGNNSGLMRGLRESEGAVDGFAAGFSQRLQTIGGGLTQLGTQITMITAPLGIALGAAANQALSFDRAMTNVGAVLGQNADEMAGLRAEILAIGGSAQAGPQAVAAAFYDIVGGVADASTHMDILRAAVATSEAGAASLTGTTSALISVMNAYGFSADQASTASDVLTQIVAKGVGTMDEFASALPNVSGLAAQTGISLDNLGAMMAYLTTKGNTAGEASTYLRQAIVSLLNPNAAMESALSAAGMASGSAALRMYGLAGTMGRLQRATGGSVDAMAEAVGSVEALQAVMAINQPQFESFLTTFQDTAQGATDAARMIQASGFGYQFDIIKSQVNELAITIGNALLPAISFLVQEIDPIIEDVVAWINANPQLTATIAAVVGVALIAGPALAAIGFAISGIGMALAVVTGPIGLLVAAIAGLGVAYATNFLGIKDTIDNFLNNSQQAFSLVLFYAEYYLGAIWDKVRPVWETLRDWFTGQLMPALTNTFENHILPVLQRFGDFLSGLWDIVRPHLEDMYNWFIESGLPGILSFITDTVMPGVNDFIDLIGNIWESVSPGLLQFADWFTNTGLPVAIDMINRAITAAQQLVDIFNLIVGQGAVVDAARGYLEDNWSTGPDFTQQGVAGKRQLGSGGGKGGMGSGGNTYNITLNGDQSGRSKADYEKMFREVFEEMAGV